MHIRKPTIILLGLVMLGSLVTFVPGAHAQQQGNLNVVLPPTDEKVKPLQGIMTMTGTYTVTYTQDAAASQVAGIPVKLTITKTPPWASAVVSPATDVVPTTPGATPGASVTTSPKQFSIAITATQDAPAFTPDTIEVTIQTSGGAGTTALSGKATAQVTADYFSVIDVNIPQSIQVARPQQAISFPVTITNLGNANTKVSFAIGDHDPGLIVQQPVPVVLQSKQTGGTTPAQTVQLQIQTPYKNGYMNSVGGVSYKITSAYALDPKLTGDSSAVSVVVTTKGFYVPGFELPLALALVGATALVTRRLRK